jgi:uncharacterized protein (TIGR00297 family)
MNHNHHPEDVDRLANYSFIFLTTFLFILEGHSSDHLRILIALLLSVLFSLSAFFINWINLGGLYTGIVFGTVILGFGGWSLAALVLLFFISSSLLSRRDSELQVNDEQSSMPKKTNSRRNGLQIWANGYWVALFAIFYFLFQNELYLVMATAALATATSDTWSTELGTHKKGRTYLITDFKNVEPGTNGGVSLKGTLGGFWGALFIGICYMILHGGTRLEFTTVIVISGFLGCIADSYLGAFYQNSSHDKNQWIHRYFESDETLNHAVNFTASGVGALIALVLIQLT